MTGWQSKTCSAVMLAVCALACGSGGRQLAGGETHAPSRSLLATLRVPRLIEPRLSVETEYAACPVAILSDTMIPPSRCVSPVSGSAPPPSILALAVRAARSIQSNANADALHTAAIIDLIWGDSGKSLDQSISYLRAAARLDDSSAATLSDLSAALLLRAGRNQDSGDLVEAIEQADRAIAVEPHNLAARYNMALALERLNLTREADSAWTTYATMDGSSPWGIEARRARNHAMVTRPVPPPLNATRSDIETYAERMPQQARELGWDTTLGRWATAYLQHDSATAWRQLAFASSLASGLKRHGRDQSLADAVRAIASAASDPRAVRSLAIAHQTYSQGLDFYNAGNYVASGRLFAPTVSRSTRSPALLHWAQLYLAATQVYAGHVERGEQMLRKVASGADTIRGPALAARSRWMLGTTLLRSGRYEQARDMFQSAAVLFRRADELENLGAVQSLVANAQFAIGDDEAGFGTMREALVLLAQSEGSIWAHNLLGVAAQAASNDGYKRAARAIQNDGLLAAAGTQLPMYSAEARLARARLSVARFDTASAKSDIAAARLIIATLPAGLARSWFTADLLFDEALVSSPRENDRATMSLDSVVTFFESLHNSRRLLPALVARAEAYLTAGNVNRATADLNRATALLAKEDDVMRDASFRASLFDAAHRVFDRLVMLNIDAGRQTDALAALERGRAFVTPRLTSTGRGHTVLPAPQQHRSAVVEYAFIGDTLLTWTVSGDSIRFHRRTLSRKLFVDATEQIQRTTETGAVSSALLPQLAALYELLIRPVESTLGPPGAPVTVVADGEVASVPFAGLYDSHSKAYFVETHPLRFAPTLHDAETAVRAYQSPGKNALVIGDPSFNQKAFPSLSRLPGADAEAKTIAREYGGRARILDARAATKSAVAKDLSGVDVFHYAGHAIVDDAHPDRSFLVLAAPTPNAEAKLSAADVRRLDLRQVRIVVLSACETLHPSAGHSGGLSGLMGAFLAAGAAGIVGSQWRVSDQSTLDLMQEFHKAYRQSGDGASALRAAQLHMIRSPDAALRSPTAWAGFKYAGQ